MKESSKFRQIRSFVIRAGRLTPGQIRSLSTLWNVYGLRVEDGVNDWGENCVLEIGFGMGESLLSIAVNNPTQHFIGIEVHPPGVGALLAAIDKHKLKNINIYQNDATIVLKNCIKNESLAKVQIFFPDPWPKQRHNKRRLIQKKFVELLVEKIKPGGLIHLATDWPDYANQMMEVLSAFETLNNCSSEGNFLLDQTLRPMTKFEKRGLQLGHSIFDLLFIKKT